MLSMSGVPRAIYTDELQYLSITSRSGNLLVFSSIQLHRRDHGTYTTYLSSLWRQSPRLNMWNLLRLNDESAALGGEAGFSLDIRLPFGA